MSAISDKLKNTIQAVFDLPKKDIETKIDQIVKATRKGESQGQQIKDILQKIEDVESKVDRVKDTIKTVNDVWKFSKNMWSQDPTWYLVDTSNS